MLKQAGLVVDEAVGTAASIASTRGRLLLKTLRYDPSEHAPIVGEHGRRNMALQADGCLVLVLPVRDDSDFAGIGVFDLDR